MTAEEITDKKHKKRAKDRARYHSHLERFRAKNHAYHTAQREKILARSRARYKAKRAADLERKRTYRRANPEVIRAQTRALYYGKPPEERQRLTKHYNAKYAEKRRAWREQNKERLAVLAAAWTKANAGMKRAATARRLALKLRATPSWADLDNILAVYESAAEMTSHTGIPYEVDHIVPLRSRVVCGLHISCNLQILTRTQNRSKGNRLPK